MLYGKLIKPLLFSLPPEQAHHIVTATLSLLGKVPGGRWLLHKLYATEDPVARTRSLRHPFQESRRNGRRIRPLRPHLPRTVGHGFRIRRGGKHHPQASAGQSQAAHLPARRGPRAAQPRRHLQPRSRPRRGAPATAARRGDRRLQHRQEHGHALRPGAGRLPQMLPQPLPVRRLFHDQRRLRSGAEGSIVPDARKHHEDSGTALRIPPRAEPVPPHPAERSRPTSRTRRST